MRACKCQLFTDEGSRRLPKRLNYCFSVLASATNRSNGQSCSNCQPNHLGKCENQEAVPRASESCPTPLAAETADEESLAALDSLLNDPTRSNPGSSYDLPPFIPLNRPNFHRSESVDGLTFTDLVNKAYQEVVHWRHNIFSVPSGKAGTAFVSELSRLFRGYGESSALEATALKAAMILTPLLLQQPHSKARAKDHIRCLERRLMLWNEGNISELLLEGKIIQQKLTSPSRSKKKDSLAKAFGKLMKRGKVKAAMRLLSSSEASILSVHE